MKREAPFTMGYQEVIPKAQLRKVDLRRGKYDPQKQELASFPNMEKPPTTCTVATRITPSTTTADTAADD